MSVAAIIRISTGETLTVLSTWADAEMAMRALGDADLKMRRWWGGGRWGSEPTEPAATAGSAYTAVRRIAGTARADAARVHWQTCYESPEARAAGDVRVLQVPDDSGRRGDYQAACRYQIEGA